MKNAKRIRHKIWLDGFGLEKGKIPLMMLSQLSEQLMKIAEGTLRLYIEGNSNLKRGKMPEWLKNSMDFTWSGISKGSTIYHRS